MIRERAFGLLSLVLVALGQFTILLAILFAPEQPDSIVEAAERTFERHWTDQWPHWLLLCSLSAGVVALVGLVADKRRDAAALGLAWAFVGFVWPYAVAFS